jgi:hypothetical protein
MIIMPMWIEREEDNGFWALLGSEPDKDTAPEWIPRCTVNNCVYAPVEVVEGKRFALVTLSETELPEKIKNMLRKK